MNGGRLKAVLSYGKRKLPKMDAGLESMINEVSDRIKFRVHSLMPNTRSTFRFQPYYSCPESGVQERKLSASSNYECPRKDINIRYFPSRVEC